MQILVFRIVNIQITFVKLITSYTNLSSLTFTYTFLSSNSYPSHTYTPDISISPEFVPLSMDKDLLHKIFVSLGGIKQELYAKSFQINDIRENLPPQVENARRKPQTCRERLVT